MRNQSFAHFPLVTFVPGSGSPEAPSFTWPGIFLERNKVEKNIAKIETIYPAGQMAVAL